MARRRAKTLSVRVEWVRVPEADDLVRELVAAHHPHLARARIVCIGRPKAAKIHGQVVLAKFRRVSRAMNAVLLAAVDGPARQFDYVIEIGMDRWAGMEPARRRIVVDHELEHGAGQDEKGRWGLRGHDVEEFGTIVRRHGLWHGALRDFAKEIQQLALPIGEPA